MLGLAINEKVFSDENVHGYVIEDDKVSHTYDPFDVSLIKVSPDAVTRLDEDLEGWSQAEKNYKNMSGEVCSGEHIFQRFQKFFDHGRVQIFGNKVCPIDGLLVTFRGWQNERNSLKQGEGHCESSADCDFGLRCYRRNPGEIIRGYDFTGVGLQEDLTVWSRMSVCVNVTDDDICNENMIARAWEIADVITSRGLPQTEAEIVDLFQEMFEISLGSFNPMDYYVGFSNDDFYQIKSCQHPGSLCYEDPKKTTKATHYGLAVNKRVYNDSRTYTYAVQFNNTVKSTINAIYPEYYASQRPWFVAETGWGAVYESNVGQTQLQSYSYALGNAVVAIDSRSVCERNTVDQLYREAVFGDGCSEELPCLEGFQTCNSDSECMPGLICNAEEACALPPEEEVRNTIAIIIGYYAVVGWFLFAMILYIVFCRMHKVSLASGRGELIHFVVFWAAASDFSTDITFALDCLILGEYLFFYIVVCSMFATFIFCCVKLVGVMQRWSAHEVKQMYFSSPSATVFGLFWTICNGAPSAFHLCKLLFGMPVTPIDYHQIHDLKTVILFLENIPSAIVLVCYLLKGLEVTSLVVLSLIFTVSRIMYNLFQMFQQQMNVNRAEIIMRMEWEGEPMRVNRFKAAKNFSSELYTEHGQKLVTTGLKISQWTNGKRYFVLAITSSQNVINSITTRYNPDFFQRLHAKNFAAPGADLEDTAIMSELTGSINGFEVFITKVNGEDSGDAHQMSRDEYALQPASEMQPRIQSPSVITRMSTRISTLARTPSIFTSRNASSNVSTITTRWTVNDPDPDSLEEVDESNLEESPDFVLENTLLSEINLDSINFVATPEIRNQRSLPIGGSAESDIPVSNSSLMSDHLSLQHAGMPSSLSNTSPTEREGNVKRMIVDVREKRPWNLSEMKSQSESPPPSILENASMRLPSLGTQPKSDEKIEAEEAELTHLTNHYRPWTEEGKEVVNKIVEQRRKNRDAPRSRADKKEHVSLTELKRTHTPGGEGVEKFQGIVE